MPKLVTSRNQAFGYLCPACRTRVPARGLLWLWFEGREWIHPACWQERQAQRAKQAEQDKVGVLRDLNNVEIEWEEPGT